MTSFRRSGTISISVWPGETTPPTVKMLRPTTWPVAGARTRARCSCSRTATSFGSTSDRRACVSRSSVATSSSAGPLDRHRLHPGLALALAGPGDLRASWRPRGPEGRQAPARAPGSGSSTRSPFPGYSAARRSRRKAGAAAREGKRSAANSRPAARPAGASAGRAPTAAPTSRRAAPGAARAAGTAPAPRAAGLPRTRSANSGGRREIALPCTLGHQPRTLREHGQIVAGQRPLLCAQVRRRHFDQDVAGVDALALADVDRGDDAALAMLDRLAVAGDRDDALRRHRRVERRERRPAEQDDEEEDDDSRADADVAARIVGRQRPGCIALNDRGKEVHPAFPCACLHQPRHDFLGRPEQLRPAGFEHEQALGAGEDRAAMRDQDDRRAAVQRSCQRLDQRGLAVGVEEGIGLVEDQQNGVAVERTRQRDALRLAGRQTGAERPKRRVVALGKLAGSARGRRPALAASTASASMSSPFARAGEARDIFLDRAFEQARLLRQIADVAAELVRLPIVVAAPSMRTVPDLGGHGAREDLGERRLARAARADDRRASRPALTSKVTPKRTGRPSGPRTPICSSSIRPAGSGKPRVDPLGRNAGHDIGEPSKGGVGAGQRRPAADHGLDRLQRAAEQDRGGDDRAGRDVAGDREQARQGRARPTARTAGGTG